MKYVNVNLIVKTYGLVGLFHGLLVVEGKRWQTSLGSGFRYLILGFYLSQIYLIKQLFNQLPENTWKLIFNYMYEPFVLFSLIIILIFGTLSMIYGVGAAKIMKSLVG